ncbi:MAG: P-type conjugative transfer protein TrbL [Desulfovibrio sp.]|nr:P-type conjugative transfer protein TrbL [Desulfovibrio sp.]
MKSKQLFILSFLIAGFVIVTFAPIDANAQIETIIPRIITEFESKTSTWSKALQGYAFDLFRLCTTLTVVLFGVKAAIGRDNIGEVFGQFISTILFCCFIAATIVNYQDWSWSIINGLNNIATNLGPSKYNATDPLIAGIELTKTIFDKMKFKSVDDAVNSIAFALCGLVILIAFALMTAQLVFVKCEALVSMNASVILLGLGGATIFKEYAISVMRYVLSVAFKLFVLQLVMGLGLKFMQGLTFENSNLEDIFIAIAVSIILLALVKSIPDVCAGIINGAHVNSGAVLGQAATATAAGAAVAVGGVLGAAMGSGRGIDATRKAAQIASMDGATGLGKARHMAGSLWQAHKQAKAEGGNLSHGERFGAAMSSRLQEMKMRNLGLSGDDSSSGSKDGGSNGQA